MRKFTALCLDKKTGMEMVLSEVSYNAACMFLETENSDNRFGQFKSILMSGSMTKIKFEKASFLYDEVRGLLLRNVS